MINGAFGDLSTKLPPDLTYPKAWLNQAADDWDDEDEK